LSQINLRYIIAYLCPEEGLKENKCLLIIGLPIQESHNFISGKILVRENELNLSAYLQYPLLAIHLIFCTVHGRGETGVRFFLTFNSKFRIKK